MKRERALELCARGRQLAAVEFRAAEKRKRAGEEAVGGRLSNLQGPRSQLACRLELGAIRMEAGQRDESCEEAAIVGRVATQLAQARIVFEVLWAGVPGRDLHSAEPQPKVALQLGARARIRHPSEQTETLAGERNRLVRRAPAHRVLRGAAQIADRLLEAPRRLEVHRELGRDLACVRAVGSLEPLGDAQMPGRQRADADALLPERLVHGVEEGVACRRRPVQPVNDVSRPHEELSFRQPRTDVFDVRDRTLKGRGHEGRTERGADNAGGREDRLLARARGARAGG